MSVACASSTPTRSCAASPGRPAPWELSLTMEHRSYDELSRLWQATTAPLRMSQVYRAAVVFIDPDTMPAPPPADLVVLGDAGPSRRHSRRPARPATRSSSAPPATARTWDRRARTVPFSQSPATVAAGQTAWLLGSDLGITGVSDHVYLLPPAGGAEVDVTAWVKAADSSAAKFVLAVPPAAGTAPAGAPDPGVYQLRVGSGALGSPGATRSGSTPVSVAALGEPAGAAGGPVLTGSPPFTVTGAGFVPGATEVLVGAGGADRDRGVARAR